MDRTHSWRSLYPFDSQWLDLGGQRLHYLDEGNGDVLLMVHGNPTWSFYWRKLITAFRDRYRVVALDHLGCGLSDKPQRYPYCLEQHTRNLVRLIEHLQLTRITLLAHDWGGAIGLNAAVTCSDQFARLVLFNTGAFPPPRVPLRIAICRLPVFGTVALRGLNAFPRAALRMATTQPRQWSHEARGGILSPYDSWANRIGIHHFVRDIPLSRRHPTYAVLERLESRLKELSQLPVQLIWGMRDWCFDEPCLRRFESIFPNCETSELAEAGHWIVEDAPDQVVSLVEAFLARHVPHQSRLEE